MSVTDSTASQGRERQAAAPRNYPRENHIPRRYKSRKSAESVAATYRRLVFFAARGEAYPYACSICCVWHVGIDSGEPWHECRWRHDQWTDYLGQRPNENAA